MQVDLSIIMRTDVFASLDKKALRFIKIKKNGMRELHSEIAQSKR